MIQVKWAVQNPPVIPFNTGWLIGIPRSWIIVIPNILASILPKQIINHAQVREKGQELGFNIGLSWYSNGDLMGLNMGFMSNKNGRVWTTRIWQFHIIPPYETLLVWRGAGFLVRKIIPSWDSKRNMSCFQTEQCGNGHCKINKMKNSVLHVLDITSTTTTATFAFLRASFWSATMDHDSANRCTCEVLWFQRQ